MRQQTYQKLLSGGDYVRSWLDYTYQNFRPKHKGKYKLRITDIYELDYPIEKGVYIDTACFSTQEELAVIHHYYEGFCYILYRNETGEKISTGFMDGAIFDEIDEEGWEWLNDNELRKLKLIPLPKVTNLTIKPKQNERHKYVATACVENRIMSVVYHFKPRVKKATEDLIDKYLQDKEVNQW